MTDWSRCCSRARMMLRHAAAPAPAQRPMPWPANSPFRLTAVLEAALATASSSTGGCSSAETCAGGCRPPSAGPRRQRPAAMVAMTLVMHHAPGCGRPQAARTLAAERRVCPPRQPPSCSSSRAAWGSQRPAAAAQRSSGSSSRSSGRAGRAAAAADADAGESAPDAGAGGQATAAQATATLVNCAVGAGILSMPACYSLTGWALGLGLTGEQRCLGDAACGVGDAACGRAASRFPSGCPAAAAAALPRPAPLPLKPLPPCALPAAAVAALETATLLVLCQRAEAVGSGGASSYSALVATELGPGAGASLSLVLYVYLLLVSPWLAGWVEPLRRLACLAASCWGCTGWPPVGRRRAASGTRPPGP